MITVFDAGRLTTVQDLGRAGLGSFGVAPSGAMDPFALRAANLLAGNDEGAAGLEYTLGGPTLGFDADAVVALCGSRFDASVLVSLAGSEFERDVQPRAAPHGESFVVRAGESLRIGKAAEGARGYLAMRGGIETPVVLGSRSTHVASRIGGLLLEAGATIPTGDPADGPMRRLARLEPVPREHAVRALSGPHDEGFDLDAFFGTAWTISTSADRTGVRLDGPALGHPGRPEIDPEGMPRGAVEIPGDGRPIVVGPDGPVTGGYPAIAVVIAADLGGFAHMRPGDTLRFVRCEVDEARAAWRERERALRDGIVAAP